MLFIIPAIIIGGCYTVIVIVIWRKGSMRGTAKTTVQSHRFNKNKGNGQLIMIKSFSVHVELINFLKLSNNTKYIMVNWYMAILIQASPAKRLIYKGQSL